MSATGTAISIVVAGVLLVIALTTPPISTCSGLRDTFFADAFLTLVIAVLEFEDEHGYAEVLAGFAILALVVGILLTLMGVIAC